MAETKTIPALRRYLPVVMPGETFWHQYQYGHDQNSCNGSRIPDFDSTSIQVFQAVPCSQDQQERKGKTVAVRETGWRIETMHTRLKI